MPLIDVGATWDQAQEEAEWPVLPTGDYQLQVASWEMETAKSGAPMINWRLEVVNHPEHTGAILFHRTPTSGKGRAFLTRFCQACGVGWEGDHIDPDQYVGRQVLGSISEGTYQGRATNNIDALSMI